MEVYSFACCYCKGFFNTIQIFQEDRDENGWQVQMSDVKLDIGAGAEAKTLELTNASLSKAQEG